MARKGIAALFTVLTLSLVTQFQCLDAIGIRTQQVQENTEFLSKNEKNSNGNSGKPQSNKPSTGGNQRGNNGCGNGNGGSNGSKNCGKGGSANPDESSSGSKKPGSSNGSNKPDETTSKPKELSNCITEDPTRYTCASTNKKTLLGNKEIKMNNCRVIKLSAPSKSVLLECPL